MSNPGNSLAAQWLGLHPCTARGQDSIPGWRTKIPTSLQMAKSKEKKKKKKIGLQMSESKINGKKEQNEPKK